MGQTSASITAPSHGGDDPRPRPCVRPRPTHVESHRRPLRIPTMRRAQPRLANIRVSNRRHRRGCAGPAPGPTAADTKVRACPCATLGQPPARLAGALHRSGRLGRGIGFFRPRPSPFEGVGEKTPISERKILCELDRSFHIRARERLHAPTLDTCFALSQWHFAKNPPGIIFALQLG